MDMSPEVSPSTPVSTPTPVTSVAPVTKPAPAVNFAAFATKVTVSKEYLTIAILGAVVGMIGLAGAAIAGGSVNHQNQKTYYAMVAGVGLLVVLAGMVPLVLRYNRAKKAQFQQFLTANGWVETAHPDHTSFANVATSLLNIGHDQKVKHEFSGSYKGLPLSAVMYQYTTGGGKSQQTHYFVDLHLTLTKQFPLIVLDNISGQWSFLSGLPDRIQGSKTLQLEGDFDKHFKTTVLPGTEQEVLQLLTPDFMAELIDCPAKIDIELEANQLFLIKHSDTEFITFNSKDLEQLFAMADVVIKNITEVSDTWQASSSPETVEAMAATALAPRQGLRVKPAHAIIGIVAFAIFALIQIVQLLASIQH